MIPDPFEGWDEAWNLLYVRLFEAADRVERQRTRAYAPDGARRVIARAEALRIALWFDAPSAPDGPSL